MDNAINVPIDKAAKAIGDAVKEGAETVAKFSDKYLWNTSTDDTGEKAKLFFKSPGEWLKDVTHDGKTLPGYTYAGLDNNCPYNQNGDNMYCNPVSMFDFFAKYHDKYFIGKTNGPKAGNTTDPAIHLRNIGTDLMLIGGGLIGMSPIGLGYDIYKQSQKNGIIKGALYGTVSWIGDGLSTIGFTTLIAIPNILNNIGQLILNGTVPR